MSESQSVERKDGTERRVYNLPPDLLERLRAYQVNQGISSEVEAARRLLHTALQLRDSVYDILNTLESKFSSEKDLRVIAADVLSTHVLVVEISFTDNSIAFKMRDGDRGGLNSNGTMEVSNEFTGHNFSVYKRRQPQPQAAKATASPSWDTGAVPGTGGDLDDEIPF